MLCSLLACYCSTRLLVDLLTCYLVNLLPRQLVSSLTCQSVFSCPLFSKSFNIMAAIFSANRLPCRKKSILVEVGFEENRG